MPKITLSANRVKFTLRANFKKSLFKLSFLLCLLFVGINDLQAQTVVRQCGTNNVDNCTNNTSDDHNVWWCESPGVKGLPVFASKPGENFVFTEYSNGTAIVEGTTYQGSCSIEVHLVLKNKQNWNQWYNQSWGEFLNFNDACSSPNKKDLSYYTVDETKSYAITRGGDCIEQGTFILSPDDPYGAQVGTGAAFYDKDNNAEGFTLWASMGTVHDPCKYFLDFYFTISCDEVCDGVDNDGDGQIDEGFDSDNDGTPDCQDVE